MVTHITQPHYEEIIVNLNDKVIMMRNFVTSIILQKQLICKMLTFCQFITRTEGFMSEFWIVDSDMRWHQGEGKTD